MCRMSFTVCVHAQSRGLNFEFTLFPNDDNVAKIREYISSVYGGRNVDLSPQTTQLGNGQNLYYALSSNNVSTQTDKRIRKKKSCKFTKRRDFTLNESNEVHIGPNGVHKSAYGPNGLHKSGYPPNGVHRTKYLEIRKKVLNS